MEPATRLALAATVLIGAAGATLYLFASEQAGPPSDNHATLLEPSVPLPSLRDGASAVYTDVERGSKLQVEVATGVPVWAGNATVVESVRVSLGNPSGGFPHYEQALDPETGRLLRVVDRCTFATDASGRSCDTNWLEAGFDAWNAPGLWGLPLIQAKTLSPGQTWTAPTGEGPTNTTVQLTVEAVTETDPASARVGLKGSGLPQGNPFRTAPVNGTLWFQAGEAFPVEVKFIQPTRSGHLVWHYRLERSTQGDGETVSFTGQKIPDRRALASKPIPFDERLPLDRGVPGGFFPHDQALEEARGDPGFQRYRSSNPSAILVKGLAGYPVTRDEPGGMGYEEEQTYRFTWMAPGTGEAWRVEVSREREYQLGTEVRNETRVTESERSTGEGLPGGPYPGADRVYPIDAFTGRFSRLPGVGEPLELAWTYVPGRPTEDAGLTLVGMIQFNGSEDDCEGVAGCLSLQRVPFLSFDLETGALWRFSGPPETLDRLDDRPG